MLIGEVKMGDVVKKVNEPSFIDLQQKLFNEQVIGKSRKSYIKNHIAVNVDPRMILNYAANKGSSQILLKKSAKGTLKKFRKGWG